ncbi:hypothetical protein EUGRSUZ_H04777 [Eucalyptus grandis]|uniref:Uncharacterized protein n=2 Tax=Eucalyptus grandis TaxID=71139 RepID=A0ACC3JY53_EUCGR|nr:hypothetical protein EUGRSUZ_H04777 [Eucalyptus grandis]
MNISEKGMLNLQEDSTKCLSKRKLPIVTLPVVECNNYTMVSALDKDNSKEGQLWTNLKAIYPVQLTGNVHIKNSYCSFP